MAFKIDKHIKPPTVFSTSSTPLYPFAQLKVGESFFVPNPPLSFRGTVYYNSVRLGRSFTCRLSYEDGIDGMRVWRQPDHLFRPKRKEST